MSRPSKPVAVLKAEGKSHRTKREYEKREREENALLTKTPMREWSEVRKDPVAHREFRRVFALLETLGKNDGLYEAVINRYAKMRSESAQLERMRALAISALSELEGERAETDTLSYIEASQKLHGIIQGYERQIGVKRDMQLKIEKENIMTIASSLRAVPKAPDQDAAADPTLTLLESRGRA